MDRNYAHPSPSQHSLVLKKKEYTLNEISEDLPRLLAQSSGVGVQFSSSFPLGQSFSPSHCQPGAIHLVSLQSNWSSRHFTSGIFSHSGQHLPER